MNISCRDEMISILNEYNLNDLYNKGTDKITDHSYDFVYGPTLCRFRDKKGSLLEIGTWNGGSAVLWRKLLPNFTLDLVDNDLSQFNHEYLSVLTDTQYDQRDAYTHQSLQYYKNKRPDGYDIIIDDGPHTLDSQLFVVTSYVELLKPGGVLIIEDIASIENMQYLIDNIPTGYNGSKYDLRHIKNRFDDIALVVSKPVKNRYI